MYRVSEIEDCRQGDVPLVVNLGQTEVANLDSKPGQVIVHFGDTPANEQTNSKPSWTSGCVIYRRKGGEADFQTVAFQKASPHVDQITGSAADYRYVVRYQGRRASDLGAPSTPATIAASGLLVA